MTLGKIRRYENVVWSTVGIAALALGLLPAILTLFMGGEDMKAMKLEDWNAAGYRVKPGSKAVGFNPRTGEALFSRDQVTEAREERREDDGEDD